MTPFPLVRAQVWLAPAAIALVYRKVSGVWHLASGQKVTADATGRATLLWTFSTAGTSHVRAKALANATYAASSWSPLLRYTVR